MSYDYLLKVFASKQISCFNDNVKAFGNFFLFAYAKQSLYISRKRVKEVFYLTDTNST